MNEMSAHAPNADHPPGSLPFQHETPRAEAKRWARVIIAGFGPRRTERLLRNLEAVSVDDTRSVEDRNRAAWHARALLLAGVTRLRKNVHES